MKEPNTKPSFVNRSASILFLVNNSSTGTNAPIFSRPIPNPYGKTKLYLEMANDNAF
jgi:hypothetical protein